VIKLFTFVGAFVGGYVGWALAARFGMLTAFLVSGAGSLVGVYLGWKLGRRLSE